MLRLRLQTAYWGFITGIVLLSTSACKKNNNPAPAVQIPVLSTIAVSNITQNSASTGGNVSADGGAGVTARGVCWSTATSPSIAGNKTTDGSGTGNFSSSMTGLSPNTTYYVRAYATNSAGTAYGQEVSFITTNVTLLNGLLSYWKLDDNTGATATDATGNWNLSFVNTPGWTVSGKNNNAIDFGTATTSHLERTGINSGNVNAYTLAAWIYLKDGSADAKYIMGMNSGGIAINAGAAEVKMAIVNDSKLAALYHTADGLSGPMQRIGETTIAVNTWYHVAAVINNGNIDLYINGALDNPNPVTNSVTTNLNFVNGRVTVGNARFYNGSYITHRWFRGVIDEAGIWNRALTSGEMSSLYNSGNGLPYPF